MDQVTIYSLGNSDTHVFGFGFLILQLINMNSRIADFEVRETAHYGELKGNFGRQELAVQILSQKIDEITVTRIREEVEP